jgi:hypothetical protein
LDTINHAAWGYAIAKGTEVLIGFDNAPFEIGVAVIGTLPDVIGYAGNVVKGNYEWYNKAHKDWKWLRWLPPYGLHIWLDSFTHGPGKRWWVERIWAEILSWIIVITIIGIFLCR